MAYPFYSEQLNFLFEGGRALAMAFPRAADRLVGPGMDPDVERLLEGIAYIAGKITEKRQESIYDVSELYFDILFPHFLCPTPAAGIVEFSGPQGYIPRGTEILSAPVLGTRCRFRTTYDVELGAFSLEDVRWQKRDRQASLTIFWRKHLASTKAPPPNHIDLFLHGEPLFTQTLYQALLTKVDAVEIVDHNGQILKRGDWMQLTPLGFSEQESLFPYPFGSFNGFRLLQEYFTLHEKFLFLRLEGFQELLAHLSSVGEGDAPPFGIRFQLNVDTPRTLLVTKQNIRLGCTPVINLFPHTADPVRMQRGKWEYRIRPAGPHLHYQVYRITRVFRSSSHERIEYASVSDLDLQQKSCPFYEVHRKVIKDEIVNHITISDGDQLEADPTLMADILSSNGKLPLGLRIGDINQPKTPLAKNSCRSITALSRPSSIPTDHNLVKQLVKHLVLYQRELTSLEGFQEALDLYNTSALESPHAAQAHRLLKSSLISVENSLVQHHYRDTPIWGKRTCLTVNESAFDNEGELFLFASILNEVVALLGPINTFTEFSLKRSKSKDTFRWKKRLATKLLES